MIPFRGKREKGAQMMMARGDHSSRSALAPVELVLHFYYQAVRRHREKGEKKIQYHFEALSSVGDSRYTLN